MFILEILSYLLLFIIYWIIQLELNPINLNLTGSTWI